jgi:hypothetical protein
MGQHADARTDFRHPDTIRISSYDMNAAFMPFQRHESGIHAVSAGPGWAPDPDHQSREWPGSAGASGVAAEAALLTTISLS